MRLPDRPRAVVTGGGGGLGRAFCLELAKRGGRMLVADIQLPAAQETVELVRKAGGEGHAILCDVSAADQVERLAKEAEQVLGGCDVLVNNAGVGVGGPVGELSLEDWRWCVDINLWGVVYGCHYFVPLMKRQRSGHILNVASVASFMSAASMAPYNVTKAGVVSLTETLHLELSRDGIGVSVLCPSWVQTKILDAGRGPKNWMHEFARREMSKAKLSAEDIARITFAAVERGKLYILPHFDARMYWRIKRLSPTLFFKMILGMFGVVRRKLEPPGDGARG